MTLEGFDQALFAEFFVCGVAGFGYAVGVECKRVSWVKVAFFDRAIPILENSKYGGGGVEALHSVIAAEQKAAKMAAIRVA
jgi:hypothetical protein